MKRPRLLIAAVALGAAVSSCNAPPQTERTRTMIVHAAKALPDALPSTLESMDGVKWMRVATTAMVNLVRVDGGKPLEPREPGTVLPFAIGAAEPLPDAGDAISAWLAEGTAVLSTASARLRGLGPGGALTLAAGDERATVVVGGVRDDPRTTGVEALVPRAVAERLGVTQVRQVVVEIEASAAGPFEDTARSLASPVPVRVGSREEVETPDAGRLLSLAEIKERFGEFSFVDAPGRWLEPDPGWVEANIVEAAVPVLGTLRCHRKVIGPLTNAMRELQAAGLAHLVVEQSHCYGPRVQFGDTLNISRHTWGIAVDINPTTNGFGDRPTQDPRLVAIMATHGFSWGGVWMTPDGMHFEYVGL